MRRILELLYSRPWLSTPGVYKSVEQVVQAKLNKTSIRASDMDLDDFFVRRAPMQIDLGGIAAIDISGVLGKKLSNIEKSCGACDYEDILHEISSAKRMGAKAFLFNIDSGGGMASGASEVAQAIKEIEVPTTAFIDSIGCSAAYYLATGCNFLMASPSAQIGSIGVIIPWIDSEKLWILSGLEFAPITNDQASLKSAGYGPSLTPEQRAHLQQGANDVAIDFQSFVKMARGANLNDEVFRAGTYAAPRALTMGLIDSIGSMSAARDRTLAEVDIREKSKFRINMPETNQQATAAEQSAAQIAELTARLEASQQAFGRRCDALEARCESLANQLSTVQRAISSVPTDESIRETVNKRFIEAEAARGHGSAIKGAANSDGSDDPKERARARTRLNAAVLHFAQGGR